MIVSVKSSVLYLLLLVGCYSCTPWKITIPTAFSDQATQMKVQSAHSKHISFGKYQTSKVKRGWGSTSTRRTGNFIDLNIEDYFYNNFGLAPNHTRTREKSKFRFVLEDPANNLGVEVFALQAKETNSFDIRTKGNGFSIFDLAGHTEDYEYRFTATILPGTVKYREPWKMQISSSYDRDDDSKKLIKMPSYLEEKGFATDNKDTVYIKSFYVTKTEMKDGRERKIPLKVKSGYELSWDGGVVCILDAFGKDIWIFNDLDPSEKMMLASIATAILIKDQ